ncbi:Anaphase-promoting complex subunit 4 WD40 [Gracilaria domingensis]|nr:Anaphase-promoting complex subunit 4 WD40 [Gracilaria domingensis]
MAATPHRTTRKISRSPFKVLDAPYLTDDFYLNLVDWGSQNVLAVGLQNCVYLWSACTSKVTTLCDLQFAGPVCSVAWNQQGTHLAIGTRSGFVQVWDIASKKLVRTMAGHSARVGCLAWNSSVLSSGGRDTNIFNRDMRCKEPFIAKLAGHTQEVCGLKWSPDDTQLASGGNDNKLFVWSAASLGSVGSLSTSTSGAAYNTPLMRFDCHVAAVKAIAWSPHARGLLASGGGTADRTIRFWSTTTSSALAAVDTGSQVCNLAWSKNVNEIVSTHGYSQNQIIVWKYPTLSKVVTLMGHSLRVLYLSVSPSGETIVTGAGDETLRFWNVFPSAKNPRGSLDSSSRLSPLRMSIR